MTTRRAAKAQLHGRSRQAAKHAFNILNSALCNHEGKKPRSPPVDDRPSCVFAPCRLDKKLTSTPFKLAIWQTVLCPDLMSWLDKVYLYCERGLDPSFWAEPLNAISNASFLVAAAIAASRHRKVSQEVDGRSRLAIWGLIALVASIGIGSFIFHTFATRWALIADVVPITVFMVSYLAFALRKFVALSWISIAVVVPLFAFAGHIAGSLTCAGAENGPRMPCLNGSLGYLPALLCLWAVGSASALRGNEAGRWLLVAGGIFLVSAGFRTVDRDFCEHVRIGGQMVGTHAFWHLLNGLTLYVLLVAAIAHRPKSKLEAKTV